MPDDITTRPRNRSLLIMVVGTVLAAIGLVLAIGGAWLALLGGSLFYLLAGLLLGVSGYLLIRGRALGALVYIGVYLFSMAPK